MALAGVLHARQHVAGQLGPDSIVRVAACLMAADGARAAPRKMASVEGLFPADVKTVGIVMPSSVLKNEKLEQGVRALERAGYKVKLGDHVRGVTERPPLAARVSDFEKMWLDPEV